MIKKKLYKRIIVGALCVGIIGGIMTIQKTDSSAREHYKKAIEKVKLNKEDGKELQSTLERRVILKESGNGYVCDYSVWAKGVDLKKTVKEIKTTWVMKCAFCAKFSSEESAECNLTMTNNAGKVSAGTKSSYKKDYTLIKLTKYWSSTNGCKAVNYDSNFVMSPKKYVKKDTVAMDNVAYLALKNSAKKYSIGATL